MNRALKAIMLFLLNHHYIGGKHFPERRLIVSKTKYLPRIGQQQFEREYEEICTKGFLIRLKKRTGKGSDWHISLNPEMLKEIYETIAEENHES